MNYFIPPSLGEDPELSHRAHLVVGMAMLGGLFGTLYGSFYVAIGHLWGAAIVAACTLSMISVPFVMKVTGRLMLAGNLHALIWTFGFAALASVEGGLHGHAIAWLATGVPLLALLILDMSVALIWCAICFVATLFFCALDIFGVDLALSYPERWRAAVTAAGYAGFALFMSLVGVLFESSRKEAFRKMQAALLELSVANEHARTSERFAHRIADATPGLVYMLDVPTQSVIYANARLCQALGFSPSDQTRIGINELKRAASGLAFERALETIRQRLQVAQIGDVIETEYVLEQHGTTSHWVCRDTLFSKTAEGEPLSILGLAENVTERKRAEEALRQADNQFKAFMRNLPGVAFIKELDGRYVYASERVDTVTGLSAADVLGLDVADLWPEVAQRTAELDGKMLATGRPIQTVETLPMADGLHYWLMHKFPIPDSNGKFSLIGGMAIDITERILAEQKVEAALRKEEVLRREIHHRVKNNLQVISSLLYLQSLQVSDPNTQEVLRESQVRARSIALVHDMLAQRDDPTNIELADYVRQLTTDLFTAFRISQDEIALKVHAEGVFLCLDAAIPCGLIVTELVSNALKYAFPEGRTGEISIEVRPLGDNRVLMIIHDNGIGLPPDLEIESARTMGLRLVRDLTRQLDGQVKFTSDHGTTVRIDFAQPAGDRISARQD